MSELEMQTAFPVISENGSLDGMESATTIDHPGVSEPSGDAGLQIDIAGYHIWDRLGSGGMGTVYRAHQLGTNRDVALKVMHADVSQVLRSRQLFVQEVRLAAKLVHPNIVRIYDSGIDRDSYYYAMELIEGVTLDRFALTRDKDPAGKTRYTPCLPRREILALMVKICRCVHEAHLRGVIHRDLKPANIMVTADGEPHVLDFGLATAVLQERIEEFASTHKSADALIADKPRVSEMQHPAVCGLDFAGTPAFMSPEQSAGRADDLDFRTDVYSLGATLFLLLTGRLPRDVTTGGQRTVLHNVAHAPLPRPRKMDPTIDRELEALLVKSLASDRTARYGTAAEMADDLARYLAGQPLRAVPASAKYVIRKWMARHRTSVAISTAVVWVVAGLTGYSLFSHHALTRLEIASREFDKTWDDHTNQFNPEITGRSFDVRQTQNLRAASAVDAFRADPDILYEKLDASGVALVNSGYCSDGEKWLKKAIDLKRSTGQTDAESLKMLNDLAVAERELGQSNQSIALSQYVIAEATKRSPDRSDSATAAVELGARDELALALGDQQRIDEELAEASAAYELSKSLHAGYLNHQDVIRAENTLAFALRDQGSASSLDQARVHVENVIAFRTASLGDTHPDTLRSKELLATIHFKSAQTNEARANALGEIDQIIKTMVLDPAHPDVLRFKADQSMILIVLQNFKEAETLLDDSLHSTQLRQMNDLTMTQLEQSLACDYSLWADFLQDNDTSANERGLMRTKAENLLQAVINARSVPGVIADPALIKAKSQLATLHQRQRKYHDAQVLVEEVLKVQQSRLGKNHPEVVALNSWLENLKNLQQE